MEDEEYEMETETEGEETPILIVPVARVRRRTAPSA
jgi:hypothetical protein